MINENGFDYYLNNFKSNNSLENDEKINLIFEIINDLLDSGTIQNGCGYCLAMSDLLQKILSFNNIDSELVECSLLIVDSNHTSPQLTLVGYENNSTTSLNKMQNHVVLVTKTTIPLIIDLSLYGRVKNVPYVVGILNDKNNISSLASITINNAVFKYSKKPVSSIPYLHQQSIINKIKHDEKVENNLNLIKRLIIVLFLISGSNLMRGMYDHYQKYIVKDNGFGPNKEVFVHKN